MTKEELHLCECGCGQETNIRRGKAQRFVHGHNSSGEKASDLINDKIDTEGLTQNIVRELFDYRDGELYCKVRRSSNTIIGDIAGYASQRGYRSIRINNEKYYTHRLIFLYHHGYLPAFLDHIDGDPLNNSIDNLREATTQENHRNRKKQESYNNKPTTSKFKGVQYHKLSKKWGSRIVISGKSKYLGSFSSEIDAAEAYNVAAIKYFGEFARLNIFDEPNGL